MLMSNSKKIYEDLEKFNKLQEKIDKDLEDLNKLQEKIYKDLEKK